MKIKDTPLRGAVPSGGYIVCTEPIPGKPGLSNFAKVPPGSVTGLGDAPSDGKTYGRLNAGWVQVLPIGGGTLTGTLIAPNVTVTGSTITLGGNAIANPALNVNGSAGTARGVRFFTASIQRWSVIATNAAEGGANSGSDFSINRYDDAGTLIDAPLSFSRVNGNASFSNTLFVPNQVIGSDTATTPYLTIDGAAGVHKPIQWLVAGKGRWVARVNNVAETGAGAGSDFELIKLDDAGNNNGSVLAITRKTGDTIIGGRVTIIDPLSSAGNQLTINCGAATGGANLKMIGDGGGSKTIKVSASTLSILNNAGTGTLVSLTDLGAATINGPNLTVNDTANTATTNLLTLMNTGTNGVNIQMTGSGGTTPSKFLRVLAGVFGIVNHAYNSVILSLTDAGALTTTGGITATTGNITATAGNVSSGGTVSATVACIADHVMAFRSGAYGGGVVSWGTSANHCGGFRVNDANGTIEYGAFDTAGNATSITMTQDTSGNLSSNGGLYYSYLNTPTSQGGKVMAKNNSNRIGFDWALRGGAATKAALPSIFVDATEVVLPTSFNAGVLGYSGGVGGPTGVGLQGQAWDTTVYTSYVDTVSDGRLKRDIAPSKVDAVALLAQIQVSEFTIPAKTRAILFQGAPGDDTPLPVQRDEIAAGSDEKVELGLIAQHVRDVLPDVAYVLPQTNPDLPEDLHVVSLPHLVPYLLRAVQQLTARIAVLEAKG